MPPSLVSSHLLQLGRPQLAPLCCACRYQVRLDAARTRDTQLLFVTTGILLRYMAGDALLSAFSHVIVDEVGVGVMAKVRAPCPKWHSDAELDYNAGIFGIHRRRTLCTA